MADLEETAWMPSGFRLSITSSITRKDEQLGFATARKMFKRCVFCACVCIWGKKWLLGFVKGGIVTVKADGFQERNESLQVQSKRLKALSLVYIIIRKILFHHFRFFASFLNCVLSHRELFHTERS